MSGQTGALAGLLFLIGIIGIAIVVWHFFGWAGALAVLSVFLIATAFRLAP